MEVANKVISKCVDLQDEIKRANIVGRRLFQCITPEGKTAITDEKNIVGRKLGECVVCEKGHIIFPIGTIIPDAFEVSVKGNVIYLGNVTN